MSFSAGSYLEGRSEVPCPLSSFKRTSVGWAKVLYGSKLQVRKEIFMHVDVPELDQKRPFSYDVLEVKPLTFTLASSQILIQIELLLIFLGGGGQLSALAEYWTEFGMLTCQSASTADFTWSVSQICVSICSAFVMVING